MSLRDYFEQRAREGSWGSLYDGPPDPRTYNFLTRRAAVLDLLAADGAIGRILDVGCGTADYAEVAVRHGGSYHGVDFAPAMVAEARRRAAAGGRQVRLAVAEGERLPFADGVFDLVLAMGYIAYFRDPRPAIAEIRRVLRPGGTLVAQVAKPDLCGTFDRAVARRLGALVRRRGRRPTPEPLPPGWVNVKYRPRELDRMLRDAGFARVGRAFNHFHVLPRRLRDRRPGLAIAASEALTRWHPGWWRAFAVNYIGKYRRLDMPRDTAPR